MLHRTSSLVVIALLAPPTGCGWLSGDAASDASGGNSAADTDADDGGADQSQGRAGNDFVRGSGADASRNPQRDVSDPYYILGQTLPQWDVGRWANHEQLRIDQPITLEKLRGRVVVVRFWTDANEACARTMPALQELSEQFRGEPVTFVGIYFPSSLTAGSFSEDPWADTQARAREWGVEFPIAEDRRTLNSWWLSRYDNLPATPTFVIGPQGRVVHLHPGPGIYPSDDPAEQICDDDYQALRAAIHQALGHQLAETAAQR